MIAKDFRVHSNILDMVMFWKSGPGKKPVIQSFALGYQYSVFQFFALCICRLTRILGQP